MNTGKVSIIIITAIALIAVGVVITITANKKSLIDEEVERFRKTPGAVLLDVRTVDEYASSHIPGSTNIPIQQIQNVEIVITDKSTPLFVYCRSGRRSGEATTWLKNAGYTDVTNIGGIINYRGKLEQQG
jgi:rhodanese-related sulfurtransferase